MALFILFLCLLASAQAASQGVCGAPILGQPCPSGGIATLADGEPGLNLGVGNPIHLVTGNKYQQELDLPAGPGAPLLEIVRHYNALDRRASSLGQGWALSYDTRLFHRAGRWQIVQADGSRVVFPAGLRAGGGHRGRLAATAKGRTWVWPDGRRLVFDASSGRLVRIESASGAIDIIRHASAGPLSGAISEIIDSSGSRLLFAYRVEHNRPYLIRIGTRMGPFQYFYEAAPGPARTGLRLQRVLRPDGMQKHYLYEPEHQAGNPYHLTGIKIVPAQPGRAKRTHTWAYDAQGRAVLSTRGGPDSTNGRISVRYAAAPDAGHDGLTETVDALGHKTSFHTTVKNGRHLLLRVAGAGCPGCSAPGSTADYDSLGRLSAINGTRIRRDESGAVRQLMPQAPGWPGLALHYGPSGRRTSWSSTLTGIENVAYDGRRRPASRQFSNGDRWEYRYDTKGRPVLTIEISHSAEQATRLRWQGRRLTRIEHPLENEARHYDSKNRLSRRTIERWPAQPAARRIYNDGFEYDKGNRLRRHLLPEGGALEYQWGAGQRLLGIVWRDRDGRGHPVIQSTPGRPGYQYGNGLHLRAAVSGSTADLTVADAGAALWSQQIGFDAQRRVDRERHHVPRAQYLQAWRYAYDAGSRLAGAQDTRSPAIWYAWRGDGSQAARRAGGRTVRPYVRRDPSGLPRAVDGYTLRYGPNRRLVQVRQGGKLLGTYQHNAFGHRIARQSGQERTEYFHLNGQLVAESQRPAADPGSHHAPLITRRYIYAGLAPVGFIDYTLPQAPQGVLYAVHSDLTGAARLVTDARRNIRWLASYGPTGAATRIAGDLTLDLRLPGQVFDPATGWHDNLLRTYSPALGQYLEPDPLGPLPPSQALGYAGQQPRRHADPLGLLLFAFDGTRYDAHSQSNVWLMSQQYQDGPVFYLPGPGSPSHINWDAITAYTATDIVNIQWQHLLNQILWAQAGEQIPIDIIGFSRGAALARHFGNLINTHVDRGRFFYDDPWRGPVSACVDLRFMGLFDTVAQFGLNGSRNAHYDLTIAAAWQWVAHAVALHERRGPYPVTSADGDGNIVEAPFIGAHADIGGGILAGRDGAAQSGDLSDVALNWMLWQARAASLRFETDETSHLEVSDPVLHDERSTLTRYLPDSDRSVAGADGSMLFIAQDDHARLGKTARDATESLIERRENWRGAAGNEVGTVQMDGYARWLQDELGWQAAPA